MDEALMSSGLHLSLSSSGVIPLHLQLDCAQGELLALVGPSGSGKTTLLRALAGLYPEVQGVISCAGETWLDSRRAIRRSPQQRQVGMVFQHYALFPHLTVQQNVEMALLQQPLRVRQQTAREMLARVKLSGLEERLPAQLSGGQKQRVALARALVGEPKLLLLDEPFAAVDQQTRYKLRRELAQLRHSLQLPILLVTHDLEEAQQLADQICVLHRGQALQVASPSSLMRAPATPEVAKLLGMQNLFRGELRQLDLSEKRIHLDWQGLPLQWQLTSAQHVAAIALHRAQLQPGQVLQWLAPPASIQLFRDAAAAATALNAFPAIVEESVLLGPHLSLRVRPCHAPDWPLSFYLSQNFLEQEAWQPGETLHLALHPQRLHLFLPANTVDAREITAGERPV